MNEINLSIYKENQIYFYMFDVLIKNTNSNKEEFLESIYISPSSYRRAKLEGKKIGNQLIKELCDYFKLKTFNIELIEEVENKLNEIYFAMYYKIYDSYEIYLEWLENMINEKYIFFPILKLFKLFLLLNHYAKGPLDMINENENLFEEIKKYKNFYNENILEVFEIIETVNLKEIDKEILSKNYTNELICFGLASRCNLKGRLIESIYFAGIAKKKFIEAENYKRVYYTNLILLSSYNMLCRFEEAYELAKKQVLSLNSIGNKEFEYRSSERSYLTACVGLCKFKEVIESLEKKDVLEVSEVCLLLISQYQIDKKEYIEILKSLENESTKELFLLLDNFLKTKDKKIIEKLEKYRIHPPIFEILKRMK